MCIRSRDKSGGYAPKTLTEFLYEITNETIINIMSNR